MRLFSVVGARPQFIKLAPLSSLLSEKHEEIIIHTGQHYDFQLSEKIFQDLDIRNPDVHLEIGSGSHAIQTGKMMIALEGEMQNKKPDAVIVFGDTNSTIAGSLAASKLNIPVIHIEAGLRSYNKNMPEEVNRIVTDHISDYLFVPTQTGMNILEREGLEKKSHYTGDIMVDTLNDHLELAIKNSTILSDLNLTGKDFNLLTLHRNYNVDNPDLLKHILNQIEELNELVVFPVHPRTNAKLEKLAFQSDNIMLMEPVGYLDFIRLEQASKRIITDSGGIQKEAYLLKKPCITLRFETEWVETVKEGWNLLLNPKESNLAVKISEFQTPENQKEIFGNNVAQKMFQLINSI